MYRFSLKIIEYEVPNLLQKSKEVIISLIKKIIMNVLKKYKREYTVYVNILGFKKDCLRISINTKDYILKDNDMVCLSDILYATLKSEFFQNIKTHHNYHVIKCYNNEFLY